MVQPGCGNRRSVILLGVAGRLRRVGASNPSWTREGTARSCSVQLPLIAGASATGSLSLYPAFMRTAFHERMDALTAQLGEMCGLAGIAMEHATQALLQADLPLAEQVITDHDRLTAVRGRAEENATMPTARQAPVAGDLRVIVSSLQNVADAERMGALALHVAKITRRRHPAHTLPEDVNGYFVEMV